MIFYIIRSLTKDSRVFGDPVLAFYPPARAVPLPLFFSGVTMKWSSVEPALKKGGVFTQPRVIRRIIPSRMIGSAHMIYALWEREGITATERGDMLIARSNELTIIKWIDSQVVRLMSDQAHVCGRLVPLSYT